MEASKGDKTPLGGYSRKCAGAGKTGRSIAEALQISPSCVTEWKNLSRETWDLARAKIGAREKRVLSGANAEGAAQAFARVHSPQADDELAARGIKTRG